MQEDAVGLPTNMHLFEYTARYKKHAGLDCYPPLQVMYATKAVNRGKLDSHCWFFDGFAYLLQPEICVLFDAGERAGGGCEAGRQAVAGVRAADGGGRRLQGSIHLPDSDFVPSCS